MCASCLIVVSTVWLLFKEAIEARSSRNLWCDTLPLAIESL
jgi:hypothetical protein